MIDITCSWGEYVKDSKDIFTVKLPDVFAYMSYSQKLEWQIEDIRKYKEIDKEKYKKLKDNLVYIVPSVLKHPHRHTTAFESSNLMILDVDKIDEQTLKTLTQKLRNDPLIHFFFRSPSGNGLKVGIVINELVTCPEFYSEMYKVYAEQFQKVYEVETDATSDCVRACYLSYDPEMFYNPDSIPVKKYRPHREKRSYDFHVIGDEDVQKAKELCHKCTSVLNYDDWFRAGAALKSLGAVGEDLFVILSTGNGSKDSESSIRRKYKSLESLERINIGSFFEIMKRNGVTL